LDPKLCVSTVLLPPPLVKALCPPKPGGERGGVAGAATWRCGIGIVARRRGGGAGIAAWRGGRVAVQG